MARISYHNFIMNFTILSRFFVMLVLLLCLLVVLSHLPDAQRFDKHYYLQVNFETAAYEIPNYAKL